MPTALKGTWWRQVRRSVSYENFYGVTAAGDYWVLVGENGSTLTPIIYQVNKLSCITQPAPLFYQRTPSGSAILNDVDYLSNEAIVFAVGDSGTVEESVDYGIHWTKQFLSPANKIDGVVCATADPNSNVIAVGANAIWGRDSSKVWTTRWTGATQQWKSVAWRPGAGWVAVGNNGWVTQSPTGINGSFIAPYQITAQNFKRIKTNDTYFMAVASFGEVWRSATGLPASWTKLTIGAGTSGVFFVGTPLDYSDGSWVVATYDGDYWYTDDNGDTWTKGELVFPDVPRNCDAYFFESALMVGGYGTAYVSYTDEQTDYVAPGSVDPGTVPPAFGANSDMAGDAVKRLVTQFRSGRG